MWAGWPNKGYWAPDVRYVDGQYFMYYSAPGSTALDAAIGLATAPTPAGPWTDIGHPVVNFVADSEVMEIDPMMFIDDDGTKYLYYGSFRRGGMHVVKLSADGKSTVGSSTQVVAGDRGEAAWVTKRDSWYYLFYSGYGCCMGDVGGGGYPVLVGRSKSPTGPFLDANGVSLTAARAGRHDRELVQRQHPVGHRPQRRHGGPVGAAVEPGQLRLPVRGALRRPAAVDGPAGLDRRLADGPGGPLDLRRSPACPGDGVDDRQHLHRSGRSGRLERRRRRVGARPGRLQRWVRPADGGDATVVC